MSRVALALKDRRVQYLVIVWLLLLKAMDIIADLASRFRGLEFLGILGFGFLTPPSRFIWDALTAFAGLWAIYRILVDVFGVSITLKPLTKKEFLLVSMLFIWFFSAAITLVQFTTLVTTPLANPQMMMSVYHNTSYNLRDIEIYGWYWIDWGAAYYDADFKTAKDMLMDGVFLVSSRYTFVSRPQAFSDAIGAASRNGLKVGIIIFHPYDADYQRVWGLPINQSAFADFSANKSWIEKVYTPKLKNIVALGSLLGVSWYVYSAMSFDEVSNLANAQLFVDVTDKITNNTTIMVGPYPPKKGITPFLKLRLMHWDWFTVSRDSLKKRPANNTSIGQFIWLYHRTEVSFEELQWVYDCLGNADRIEISALRYGDQTWSDAVINSILENPTLIQYFTTLNLRIKQGDPKGYVTLMDWDTNNVTLDLSVSYFEDPISVYGVGDIYEGGTKYVGASYFIIKRTTLAQKMIEMRFSGNGTDGMYGWFVYQVKLEHPIQVSENATLLLLLRLTPSTDGTAWALYRMDLKTEENSSYSLCWQFQDIPGNYVFRSENGTKSSIIIGSATEWRLYQFDIQNVFYTSFSRKPANITSIEYGVGAELDNEVKSQFLLAKISPQPLEINGKRIEDIRPSIPLKNGNLIEVKGLYIRNLPIVTRIPYDNESVHIQWMPLKIYRNEFYEWLLEKPPNATQIETELTFNIFRQTSKILYMGKEITIEPQRQETCTLKSEDIPTRAALLIIGETNTLLLPVVVCLPVLFFLIQILSKLVKVSYGRSMREGSKRYLRRS